MTELEKHQAHRIECLEAAVRRYRQALRAVVDPIIDGPPGPLLSVALAARELLEADEESMG